MNELAQKEMPLVQERILKGLDFALPPALEAGEPPEARGLRRDDVRLMVSTIHDDRITHSRFHRLTEFLEAGDLLVINTSGTLNAAVPATRADGTPFELHLSTQLPTQFWVVEMRQVKGGETAPFFDLVPGERFSLPAGGAVTVHRPYCGQNRAGCESSRLWTASFDLPLPLVEYLDRHGQPIRYSYVVQGWPLEYYQTVYATEPGSAEMPSAGRAFTPELITRLVARGVQIAPVLLHTGVASLEAHEPPYEEFFRVPAPTAALVNQARAAGRRVIAVGTTVVRALESAVEPDGQVHGSCGWTDLVITADRPLRAVDGLLTGFHEPKATHLDMLAALAGFDHLELAYQAALEEKYLWHEFGDLHLILP